MTKEMRDKMILDICRSANNELEDVIRGGDYASKAELIAKESIVDCFKDGDVFEFISDPVVDFLRYLDKPLDWLYARMITAEYKDTEDFLVRTTQEIDFDL